MVLIMMADMFLLTSWGLQAFYPSQANRFHGFLELFERGVPIIVGDEYDEQILGDLSRKVKGVLSDLMVLYFTLRASRGDIHLEADVYDALEQMFDNIRLALYIAFRLYTAVREELDGDDEIDVVMPAVPHHARENDWLYDNYCGWRELMDESYSGRSIAVEVMRQCVLDPQDVQCMCYSRARLEQIMSDAQFNGIPVCHLLRPINYATAVYPTVRRMVELELRMRTNNRGVFGETEIAPWHSEAIFAVPPSAATFVLERRDGTNV